MGKIEEKKTFKYVVTCMLYRHTNVLIKVGKKTYEFVNVCDDNKTAFGGNTIAVLYDFKAQKYIAVKVDDEKFNKVETIILPNQ
jgi:hypothetical protein